jgi:hypothetical protein
VLKPTPRSDRQAHPLTAVTQCARVTDASFIDGPPWPTGPRCSAVGGCRRPRSGPRGASLDLVYIAAACRSRTWWGHRVSLCGETTMDRYREEHRDGRGSGALLEVLDALRNADAGDRITQAPPWPSAASRLSTSGTTTPPIRDHAGLRQRPYRGVVRKQPLPRCRGGRVRTAQLKRRLKTRGPMTSSGNAG